MELMLLKWKRSYVSDTYGLSVWGRNKMREYVHIAMRIRNILGKTFCSSCRASSLLGYGHFIHKFNTENIA